MACQVREKKSMGQPSVLILDGTRMHRQALRALLLGEGYQVYEAGDLSTALHVVARIALHAAFVDLRLPGVDGLTAIRELTKYSPDLNVIVLIGAPSTETRSAVLEAGASAVVVNGDPPNTVLRQLRYTVESSSHLEVSIAAS